MALAAGAAVKLSSSLLAGTPLSQKEVRPRSFYATARALPAVSCSHDAGAAKDELDAVPSSTGRRGVLTTAAAVLAATSAVGLNLAAPLSASALVPTTAVAGRVPGLSDPDERGWRTYKRPPGKSGGHGVGWSEFEPYSFAVPQGWEEIPVSIADLGGTEIDLRFTSSAQGKLSVVVAPVLRFSDTLGNDARIEKVGTPEQVINAFGPEVTGESVEGKVVDMAVVEHSGLKYYQFEVEPHYLISTTACGNRLYILALACNGRQWKKFEPDLREILGSFRIG